jgi:hypothetical protein
MKVTTIGIDLAKNVIQVHGVDQRGKVVLRRQLRRSQVMDFFAQRPPCARVLADHDHCPRSHVLLFADNFVHTLVEKVGKCFFGMFKQAIALAGLAGRHRRWEINQPLRIRSPPAHHFQRCGAFSSRIVTLRCSRVWMMRLPITSSMSRRSSSCCCAVNAGADFRCILLPGSRQRVMTRDTSPTGEWYIPPSRCFSRRGVLRGFWNEEMNR